MTAGEKIKEMRSKLGLTQADLAAALKKQYKRCGITRDDISNWELNRHQPHWPKAKVLVQFFSITLDNLFFEDNTAFLTHYRKKNLKRA